MDKEKLIKEFEEICCYTMRPHEFRVLNDVLVLLKKQEEQIKNRDESLEKAREEIKWLRRMLKEQEAEWIYGEDKTGADGWHCSYCGFFEPWFYEFTDDIDFIRVYRHCPGCGRKMTSYTGMPMQEGR